MPAGRGHVPREVLFVLPSRGNRCPGLAVCAHAHQHCEIALQISLPWGNLWEAGRFSSLAERRDVGASSLRAGCAFGKCWWGTAHLWPVPMVQEGSSGLWRSCGCGGAGMVLSPCQGWHTEDLVDLLGSAHVEGVRANLSAGPWSCLLSVEEQLGSGEIRASRSFLTRCFWKGGLGEAAGSEPGGR